MLQLRAYPSLILGILCYSYAMCIASEVYLYIKPSTTSKSLCLTESCLTLEQFRKNASQYSNSSASLVLEFLPGNHSLKLQSIISIHNVTHLKFFSRAENVRIIYTNDVMFELINVPIVELVHLTFDGFGRSQHQSRPVLNITTSNLYLRECKFHHSQGGVLINAESCNIEIYNSEFINQSSKVLEAVNCNVSGIGSYYYGSNAIRYLPPAVFSDTLIKITYSYLNFSLCEFNRNGPLLLVNHSTIAFCSCQLNENRATLIVPRVVFDAYASNITVESSHFHANIGWDNVLNVHWCNVTIKNTTVLKNEARYGPVLKFSRSTVVIYDDITIAGNIPLNNSVSISLEDSILKTNMTSKLVFMDNRGFFLISNSEIRFSGTSVFLNNSNSNLWLSGGSMYEGGAITGIGSTVRFMDSVTFLDNYSRKNGGALSAIGSKIFIHKNIRLAKNKARDNGGGMYLFATHLICEISCIFSVNTAKLGNGGGLYAVDSIIFLSGECRECRMMKTSIIFSNNNAVRGGGIYFEATDSELRGPKDTHQRYEIVFNNNYALMEGKAIYVDDSRYLATCNQHHAQCFIQTSPPSYFSNDKWFNMTGNITRTTIFGGLLDECSVNNAFSERKLMKGIEYLIAVTRDQNITQIITSYPVRVDYCNEKNLNNYCKYQFGQRILNCIIQRGKQFYVPVTAVDQVNRSVNASISSALTGFPASRLANNKYTQQISSKCTNLTLNVYSLNDNETLHVFPKNQCNRNKNKIITVHITFENCVCPVEFHVDKQNKTSCECECDPKIRPYKESCNLSSVSRSNRGQGWISYDKNTGFLYHSFCPYDFCLPPDKPVKTDLSLQNGSGSDAQCDFNRSGLLCGKCKLGLSLSLSSSRCLQCPEINWPWALLVSMVKIIGGLVLVATILILNLTVSIGALNGLIFYANILAADHSFFLSFSKPNFPTVFISWLNLDLGIDVCYFKGIDAYSKAWLNILFPTYIITVLLLIILISKYSLRFGRLFGKINGIRWQP